jgi:hypothetical protein
MDSRINPCRFAGSRWLMCVVLGFGLSACATQTPPGSGAAARAALETTKTEDCSIVGIMACKATSLLSGNTAADRQSTCFVSQSSSGGRTETCGSVESKAPTSGAERSGNSFVAVRLGWSDNSSNENGFVIERCDQIGFKGEGDKKIAACNSGWTIVGSVGANVTSYIDNSAVANHTYLYRVKAVNRAGDSGYTTEGVITTGAK